MAICERPCNTLTTGNMPSRVQLWMSRTVRNNAACIARICLRPAGQREAETERERKQSQIYVDDFRFLCHIAPFFHYERKLLVKGRERTVRRLCMFSLFLHIRRAGPLWTCHGWQEHRAPALQCRPQTIARNLPAVKHSR
jgi:hypothetical protein